MVVFDINVTDKKELLKVHKNQNVPCKSRFPLETNKYSINVRFTILVYNPGLKIKNMSIYQKLTKIGSKFLGKHILFKHGFNLSPMYRRSTGKVTNVSEDLMNISIKLPINYKNRNYVNSIFGGSMFSAVDPIPMVQLMNILGEDYVVWDKSAEIFFKRPAKESLYADFVYVHEEVAEIKKRVSEENEITIVKKTELMDKAKSKVFCEVRKTIYVADKAFYKKKRAKAKKST